MSVLSQLNSPFLYLVCGGIILFVAGLCVFFMVRAWQAGLAIGMDRTKMKRVVISSATFAVLPSVGILLGVIALSGSLGTPWPWLRLSVIGALHYETQVAVAAAEAAGLSGLNISEMTLSAFSTIALLMSLCIIWGMVMSIFFNKRYLGRLKQPKTEGKSSGLAGFGDTAMTAMFIGLVSAYIGSYIGKFVSGEGLFTFSGSLLPILVVLVAALAMSVFVWLGEKKNMAWLESFSIAGSMLIAMTAAVFLGKLGL